MYYTFHKISGNAVNTLGNNTTLFLRRGGIT